MTADNTPPTDPNYIHGLNYSEIYELATSIPAGWIRRDPSPGQAPFLHVLSGRTSWKHPNFKMIADAQKIMDAGKRKQQYGKDNGYSTKVKKLRLLLQAGAPLGAVEQKARLDGVDIAAVLSPRREHDTDDEGESSQKRGMPETLRKKYKRMIKVGVPMDRVCQLAAVEAGLSEDTVMALLGNDQPVKVRDGENDGELIDGHAENAISTNTDPRMVKFQRMHKAGIPLSAIRNSARLQGYTSNDLHAALGIEIDESEGGTNDSEVKGNQATFSSNALNLSHTSDSYFTPSADGKVAFPSSNGTTTYPLTDLVRKMVQTVQKTARFDVGSGKEVIVDNTTLFHALGALKGFQFARDEYNSTIGWTVDASTREVIHAKRAGLLEVTRSLGIIAASDGHVDINGLDELVSYVEKTHKEEIERSEFLIKDGLYDYDSLHRLYPPGSLVLAKHAGGGGVDSFAQVVWNRYTQGNTSMGKPVKYFQLCVRYIVPCGGGKATFAEVVEGMEMFEGIRSLSASAAGAGMGLAFVPPMEEHHLKLIRQFSRRGEMYNRIVSSHQSNTGKNYAYMEYERGCFFQKTIGTFSKGKASAALASGGRVVLDFDGASENGHSISIGRDDMIEGLQLKLKEYKLHLRSMQQNKSAGPSTAEDAGDMVLFSQVPHEYLPLVWPSMIGFSLTSKSWGDVLLDGVKDINFDPDIFDRLFLPSSRKRMIKALITHTNVEGGFHDLVAGKGEGTVFLLYGEPGNGKTLTAEAVAETLHRPLYSVSMGTLGTTADELEKRLSEILLLSSKWNALVLLDEADSFLEARSPNSSLERNAMVSVMLRLVEYHQGILFLTSNRIESLDPAFQTRITLALRYDSLDLDGRAAVWTNLLEKSGFGYTLDTIDVRALAVPVLNGRDIKNALRLAMAMAADQGESLTQELLIETAMTVNGYRASMNGDWKMGDRAVRKRRSGIRSFWRR